MVHRPTSWEVLAEARKRLVFEELLCLSLGLSLLRTRREEGGATPFVRQEVGDFIEGLPFAFTGAQSRAVAELFGDMAKEVPMNRLLQGDVGSGKTAVAAACIALAAENGCQSTLMAPTELLAQQHYSSMEQLLRGTKLRLGLLVGSMTEKQKRTIKEAAALGEIDLLIGTHALLSEGLAFFHLGLVITDEQHRFGVLQRAALSARSEERRVGKEC